MFQLNMHKNASVEIQKRLILNQYTRFFLVLFNCKVINTFVLHVHCIYNHAGFITNTLSVISVIGKRLQCVYSIF